MKAIISKYVTFSRKGFRKKTSFIWKLVLHPQGNYHTLNSQKEVGFYNPDTLQMIFEKDKDVKVVTSLEEI